MWPMQANSAGCNADTGCQHSIRGVPMQDWLRPELAILAVL